MPGFITPLSIGFGSLILQTVLVRELLTLFSGNELDIGLTLSVWLLFTGIGSALGHRLKRFDSSLGILLVGIGSISMIVMHLIAYLKAWRIESVSIGDALILTLIVLGPICLMSGATFPLAVRKAGDDAGRTYGIEALGSFAGGAIFTFVVSGRYSTMETVFAVVALYSLLSLLLLKGWLKAVSIIAFAMLFALMNSGIHKQSAYRGLPAQQTIDSKYGEIALTRLGAQTNVYHSGHPAYSYPDSESDEMKAHLSYLLHPNAHEVLLIGGSPGVAGEIARHKNAKVDFVELDPEMAKLASRVLDDMEISKDKINVIAKDGRRYVKNSQKKYDLIILNMPGPATGGLNRFYTLEFMKEAKLILNHGGVFAATLKTATGYMGRRAAALNGDIYGTIASAFNNVVVSTQEYGIVAGSDSAIESHSAKLYMRHESDSVITKHFHPGLLKDVFDPMGVESFTGRLKSESSVNTDSKPTAYLHSLFVWTETQGGGLWFRYLLEKSGWVTAVLIIGMTSVTLTLLKKRAVHYIPLFTTGAVSMSMSVIVLLGFQSLFGFVYESVGLLNGLFMLGLGAGAFIAKPIRPIERIRKLDIAMTAIALLLGTSIAGEAVFYVIMFLLGFVTSMEFVALDEYIGIADASKRGGRLYWTDLLGSFSGALATALFLVPVYGVRVAVLFMAGLKILSLASIYKLKDE